MAGWRCPYCQQLATLLQENISSSEHTFEKGNKDGNLAIVTSVVVCPNDECREYVINAGLYKAAKKPGSGYLEATDKPLISWRLKPKSLARVFPDYIPQAIREDYEEACLIRDGSAKASATLSRRCLQGMIRDFWGIVKPHLVDEVEALKDKVDPATWEAIDAVRSIGNIGAHMGKDINLIIDVEPEEADLLIGLIEQLIGEWYIHRHERDEHMKRVVAAAQAKKIAKNPATT